MALPLIVGRAVGGRPRPELRRAPAVRSRRAGAAGHRRPAVRPHHRPLPAGRAPQPPPGPHRPPVPGLHRRRGGAGHPGRAHPRAVGAQPRPVAARRRERRPAARAPRAMPTDRRTGRRSSSPSTPTCPAAEAARTGRAVWVGGRWPRHGERFPSLAGTGSRSAAAIPLAAEDRVVGVLTVGFDHELPLEDDDRRFLVALAEQAAVALERARLYDSERLSRRQAEQRPARRTLELARALQTSLLPPRLPDVPGLDLGARYHPALAGLEVGGDFYDVFDTGGDWAVVIGDVCGKGPEAAALTALARYTIRSVAMDLRHPAQVLRKLNDTLLHHQLDERFCTVAYGRVVPSVGGVRVSVCRGGHPPPLVRAGDRRGRAGRRRRRRSSALFPEIRLWEETAQLHAGRQPRLLHRRGHRGRPGPRAVRRRAAGGGAAVVRRAVGRRDRRERRGGGDRLRRAPSPGTTSPSSSCTCPPASTARRTLSSGRDLGRRTCRPRRCRRR